MQTNLDYIKELKSRYNQLKDLGYELLYVSKLDDTNYFAIVLPKLDELVRNTNVNKKVADIQIYNIQNIFNEPNKNYKYIKCLTTPYKIINKKYKLNVNTMMNYIKSNSIKYKQSSNIILTKLSEYGADLLKQYTKEQLVPVEQKPYKLCPDQYKNVYIISDTHFGHSNIIRYEHRDEKLNIETIEEHDNVLITNWNNVVKNGDLVLILGDFSFHKSEQTMEILKQLNGDKVLIEGNHDSIYLDDKKFDRSLFKAIYDYKETTYKGTKLVLMHYMIQEFKHKDKDKNPYVQLFGHIHSIPYIVPRHSYNVGADINNYTPVKLELAINKALSKSNPYINGTL